MQQKKSQNIDLNLEIIIDFFLQFFTFTGCGENAFFFRFLDEQWFRRRRTTNAKRRQRRFVSSVFEVFR